MTASFGGRTWRGSTQPYFLPAAYGAREVEHRYPRWSGRKGRNHKRGNNSYQITCMRYDAGPFFVRSRPSYRDEIACRRSQLWLRPEGRARISVISVVKCIYVRLRFVMHNAAGASFLAQCRAIVEFDVMSDGLVNLLCLLSSLWSIGWTDQPHQSSRRDQVTGNPVCSAGLLPVPRSRGKDRRGP